MRQFFKRPFQLLGEKFDSPSECSAKRFFLLALEMKATLNQLRVFFFVSWLWKLD